MQVSGVVGWSGSRMRTRERPKSASSVIQLASDIEHRHRPKGKHGIHDGRVGDELAALDRPIAHGARPPVGIHVPGAQHPGITARDHQCPSRVG